MTQISNEGNKMIQISKEDAEEIIELIDDELEFVNRDILLDAPDYYSGLKKLRKRLKKALDK